LDDPVSGSSDCRSTDRSLDPKWLKAGVMEDGRWFETKAQGSVISPTLANLYLHHVLDVWAKVWREKVARGDRIIVRYADDGASRAQRAEEGSTRRAGVTNPCARAAK
jgi:hypothetical protein